jgi:hypothetical protein
MGDATGEAAGSGVRVAFDRRLKLEFHGASVTSDAGLLAFAQNGAPFTGTLAVEVTNLTTFGSEAAACPLNGLQIESPSLNGTLACKGGHCKGNVLPVACLPRACANVSITTELRLLQVLDAPTLEGGRAIARPGLFAPSRP